MGSRDRLDDHGVALLQLRPLQFLRLRRSQGRDDRRPSFHSAFYDLGTWFFHATGFTAVPFVHRYLTGPDFGFGNDQRWIRGFRAPDPTVPALPAVGVVLLGASLLLAAASLRRPGR